MIRKVLATVAGLVFVFTATTSFAQKGTSQKTYKGAGIGPQVSQEAKVLKESGNKTGFGKEVKSMAENKTRIETHKEEQKTKKTLKKSTDKNKNVKKPSVNK